MRDADRVLDRLRIRASVTDDASAADAEEWGAAVFGVVHALLQSVECALREECADLALHALFQFFAQGARHELAKRFRRFEHDVADEAITDDDVGVAVVDIAPFGVADEVESRLL